MEDKCKYTDKSKQMFGLVGEDIYAYTDRIQVVLFLQCDLHINLLSRHLVFLRSFFYIESDIESCSHLFGEQRKGVKSFAMQIEIFLNGLCSISRRCREYMTQSRGWFAGQNLNCSSPSSDVLRLTLLNRIDLPIISLINVVLCHVKKTLQFPMK